MGGRGKGGGLSMRKGSGGGCMVGKGRRICVGKEGRKERNN